VSDVVFDAEAVSHFIHADMPAHEVDALLQPLRITVVPVDKALAHLAGRLPGVAAGAGLSLGDPPLPRTGTARRDTRLTNDQSWKTIAAAAGVKVVTIRQELQDRAIRSDVPPFICAGTIQS
jgi:PIN domain nuclease of toxin-antitoxin system